jgi:2-polyprenyl-3-methyl-5-hydroxy-6-metoxy-1,4-benzoquinol methylase
MLRVNNNIEPKDFLNFSIHFARYKFVKTLLNDNCNNIFELGCGNGYGSAYLAENGFNVVATDVDHKLKIEWKKYKGIKNLKFINYENKMINKFDAVISLEVIEHIKPNKLDAYFNLIKTNLREGGIHISSTPRYLPMNKRSENRRIFHEKEYKLYEYRKILKKHFSNVFIFSQNDLIISDQNYENAWNFLAICTN